MNISQLLNNGSIIDAAMGADPLALKPSPLAQLWAQPCWQPTTGPTGQAAQAMIAQVDSLCRAKWPRKELAAYNWSQLALGSHWLRGLVQVQKASRPLGQDCWAHALQCPAFPPALRVRP